MATAVLTKNQTFYLELAPVAIIWRKHMDIKENTPLGPYTTFKIGGPARFFCVASSEADVVEAAAFASELSVPLFVLGGGSNLLVSDDGFAGLVMKMEIAGIEDASVGPDGSVSVSAGAGVVWDDFVAHTVERGWQGLENLSAIPGTVGAAPVQNVGAYGVEASQAVSSVRAFDVHAGAFVELSNAECRFAYRDSVFKHQKGRYIITRVTFALRAGGPVDISYKDLRDRLAPDIEAASANRPSVAAVRQAVIEIRAAKLPDWKKWGTAGSFFKNPVIAADHFKKLSLEYPGLPGFSEPDGRMKVPLGYVLDKICGARGLCIGDVCTYEKQALVVMARKAGARASDVVAFTRELMRQVKEKTGIDIEAEVEWVN